MKKHVHQREHVIDPKMMNDLNHYKQSNRSRCGVRNIKGCWPWHSKSTLKECL